MSREPSIRPARSASDIVQSKLPAFPTITIVISRPARSSAFDENAFSIVSSFKIHDAGCGGDSDECLNAVTGLMGWSG